MEVPSSPLRNDKREFRFTFKDREERKKYRSFPQFKINSRRYISATLKLSELQ